MASQDNYINVVDIAYSHADNEVCNSGPDTSVSAGAELCTTTWEFHSWLVLLFEGFIMTMLSYTIRLLYRKWIHHVSISGSYYEACLSLNDCCNDIYQLEFCDFSKYLH